MSPLVFVCNVTAAAFVGVFAVTDAAFVGVFDGDFVGDLAGVFDGDFIGVLFDVSLSAASSFLGVFFSFLPGDPALVMSNSMAVEVLSCRSLSDSVTTFFDAELLPVLGVVASFAEAP